MERYLIAHKARGEQAFDVAEKQECPLCFGKGEIYKSPTYSDDSTSLEACEECDGEGYWWIVCTSGHRAYAYGSWALDELADVSDYPHRRPMEIGEPPESLPEHYQVSAAKGQGTITARDLLKNLIKREPVERRGL